MSIRSKTKTILVLVLLLFAAPRAAMAQPRRAESTPPPMATPKLAIDATAPYGVDLDFGFARFQSALKPDAWCPVWVTLEAKKGDIAGHLAIQQHENPLQITIPFQVAKGVKKRYLSYYRFDPRKQPQVEVDIRTGLFGHDGFSSPVRFADDGEQHILALPDESGGLASLARPGIEAARQLSDSEDNTNRPGSPRLPRRQTGPSIGATRVIYGASEYLPDDPVALEALDGIVITTARVRAITPRQWEALRAWVANGGRLLLAGGKHQPFIAESPLKDAFGLALAPSQPVPAAACFGARGAATSETLLVSWPSGPWSRIALGDATHPLIVSKPVGRGWFHVCAAALDENTLRLIERNADSTRLWPRLLENHFAQTPLKALAADGEGVIGQELQRPFGFNLVGAGWVFAFLGSYILLVLPLTWIVCGRLKRREWAWPAAIVLALGFAWYGYSSGLRSQSSIFQVNELTMLTQPAGATSARAATFSSIFSPRRYSTDLQTGGGLFPDRMNNAIPGFNYYNEDLYADRALTLCFQPSSVSLGDLFFHPWSARNLRSDFTVPAKGGVTLEPTTSTKSGNAPLKGRIANRTAWRFEQWWIVSGQSAWRAHRALEPGATLDLADAVAFGDYPVTSRPNSQGRQTSNNPTAQIVRDAINAAIIEPALRENATASEQRQNYSNGYTDQFWTNHQAPLMREGEFCFIGQASGSISPLLAGMRLERRRGVTIYEAALPPAAEAPRRPTQWRPALLDPGAAYNSNNYYGGQPVSVKPAAAVLRTRETDIQLVPNSLVDPGTAGSLTFSFKIVNSPNPKQNFSPHQEMRPGGTAQSSYQVAGCPVLVYNLNTKAWEPTTLLERGKHTVAPLRDYLSPATSALTLRIDAEPAKILFRESDAKDGGSANLKTGEQLWGNDLHNRNYGYDSNSVNNVQIQDISVTLGDASTPSSERSAQ